MTGLATSLVLSTLLAAQPGDAPSADENVSGAEVNAAVKQLGSDDFTIREKATDFLWRVGPAAASALEVATASDDLEVATRARRILSNVRLGIPGDLPEEDRQLLGEYVVSDLSQKRSILKQIHARQDWRMFVTLLKIDPDDANGVFAVRLATNARRSRSQALAGDKLGEVERLLAAAAAVDSNPHASRDYAAFLLFRGNLDNTVARLKASGEYRRDPRAARILARLLQVQGRLSDARAIADLTADKYLKADLYFRLQDWESLAHEPFVPGERGVQKLGATAAFNRLAGNEKQFEKAVAGLQALAAREPFWSHSCAAALMINGRWKEAIEISKTNRRSAAFEVLSRQMRFTEAFQCVGVTDPRAGAATWFVKSADRVDPTTQPANEICHVGRLVASALFSLGEVEEAKRVLSQLAKFPEGNNPYRTVGLFETEYRLGLREQAMKRALQLLEKDNLVISVMYVLYPKRPEMGRSCWQFLRGISPAEDRAATLQKLQTLMQPREPLSGASLNMREVAQQVERAAAERKLTEQIEWIEAVAETCVLQGELKLAREYFGKQAQLSRNTKAPVGTTPHSVAPLMRIGDLYAQEQTWLKAAEAYGRAWRVHMWAPLPLYLQGHALTNGGEREAGTKLMALAVMLPLANCQRRQGFAEGLNERGFTESALEQWTLILRLGPSESWEGIEDWWVQQAAKALADHTHRTDKLLAASLRQRYLFGHLIGNAGFVEASSYSDEVHLIHKNRALGLLEVGSMKEAVNEIEQAHRAVTGDLDFVKQIMPRLVAAGLRAEAEKLFNETYQAYDQVCRDFPRSANHHNRLAWLTAQCDRQRLDEALAHALEAVRLEPEKAAYLDTLAEVRFQRGERQEAVSVAKLAVQRDPSNLYLQQQLRRFETAQP